MKRLTIMCAAAIAASALALLVVDLRSRVFVQGALPDPATCNPAQCGQVSPLIPMQSVEAVHMGLVWKTGSDQPKILFHARFPEYIPNDVADPAVVDAAFRRP